MRQPATNPLTRYYHPSARIYEAFLHVPEAREARPKQIFFECAKRLSLWELRNPNLGSKIGLESIYQPFTEGLVILTGGRLGKVRCQTPINRRCRYRYNTQKGWTGATLRGFFSRRPAATH